MTVRILEGDALTMLRTLPSASVQCVITSPPYMGLRAYGTNPQVWDGDPEHGHEWGSERLRSTGYAPSARSTLTTNNGRGPQPGDKYQHDNAQTATTGSSGSSCPCGAWRGELGSEPTPGLFIEHLLLIFEEVKRVLRPDGCCFVNLGDSYSGSRGNGWQQTMHEVNRTTGGTDSFGLGVRNGRSDGGIPAKNLLLIPERFAIGMQEAGWTVRSRIAWCKTSAMPESVRDRPTSAWEHIFLFSKSPRYFWDADAVRQPLAPGTIAHEGTKSRDRARWKYSIAGVSHTDAGMPSHHQQAVSAAAGANLRNYWLLGPEPSSLEHYAGFPTELPKRCILAGTSGKGACPACGSPWVRQTSSRYENPGNRTTNGPRSLEHGNRTHGSGSAIPAYSVRLEKRVETTGWAPSCSCPPAKPRPCVVLDPFLGSGTTALVADRLGRDAIGIELSPDYVRMAKKRLESDAPMVSDPVEVVAGGDQLGLFEEAVS